MRIWAALILLAFLIPIVTVAAASSDHDNDHGTGRGTITFTQTATISGPTMKDDEAMVVTVKETLSFTGNMTGTALTIERNVMHNNTDEGQKVIFTTFHGWGNFTGTISGTSVMLHIRYEGVRNSTYTRGNFVFKGDTSQMVDVHGEGHFRGAITTGETGSSGVNYTMHWNTATRHAEDNEADDSDREKD
jgi:hypothetical protein